MSVKITQLEVANLKKVQAVALEPSPDGLTVIGGRNGQGKTSVLDALCWALGGEKLRPVSAQRQGSVLPPEIHVRLSNGLEVTRSGKNGALKVTDPAGAKSGQKLLDTFIEQLALNLPKFMNASDKEKAETLLRVIGVGPELQRLEMEEAAAYSERTVAGRTADQKAKYAAELPWYEGLPSEPVSASDLIRRQQDILARNAQRQQWIQDYDAIMTERCRVDDLIRDAEARLRELKARAAELEKRSIEAQRSPAQLRMESTEALEADIAAIDETNRKIRANLDREKALEDARACAEQYERLTQAVEDARAKRRALLESAPLPLPGLSVEQGSLRYNGFPWSDLSGSEQLRVAVAIVRALNPECGFVLLDKLEQMDLDTLRDFGAWLEGEGLQVIATRVSTGDECSIIIEDGTIKKDNTPAPGWTPGKF